VVDAPAVLMVAALSVLTGVGSVVAYVVVVEAAVVGAPVVVLEEVSGTGVNPLLGADVLPETAPSI